MLAALGKPVEARQAATVHLLFNLGGVLGWCFFLPQLASIAQWTSDDLPRQIANAHAIFNISTALVLIGFSGWMAKTAQVLVRYRTGDSEPLPLLPNPHYLDDTLLDTPTLALDRLRREVGHLGEQVVLGLNRSWEFVLDGSQTDLQALGAADLRVNHLQLAMIDYARKIGRRELTHNQSNDLNDCTTAANYLEHVGDIMVSGIIHQGLRRLENNLNVSNATATMIHELHLEATKSVVAGPLAQVGVHAEEVRERRLPALAGAGFAARTGDRGQGRGVAADAHPRSRGEHLGGAEARTLGIPGQSAAYRFPWTSRARSQIRPRAVGSRSSRTDCGTAGSAAIGAPSSRRTLAPMRAPGRTSAASSTRAAISIASASPRGLRETTSTWARTGAPPGTRTRNGDSPSARGHVPGGTGITARRTNERAGASNSRRATTSSARAAAVRPRTAIQLANRRRIPAIPSRGLASEGLGGVRMADDRSRLGPQRTTTASSPK